MTMPIDSSNLEAELSKAKTHLTRLEEKQQRQQQQYEGQHQQPGGDDTSRAPDTVDAATELYQRAKKAQDQINLIELNRGVVNLVSDLVKNNNQDADAGAGSGGGSATDLLAKATETCTSVGLLLLRHPPKYNNTGAISSSCKSQQFHTALSQWYNTLHASTRQIALSSFSRQLRKTAPEYPSNERSSSIVADALAGSSNEWNISAKCLVELQIVHDALQMQSQIQQQAWQSQEHQTNSDQLDLRLPPSWRLDIIDELCRPLAERLRFHFLEEQTGLVTAANSSTGQGMASGGMVGEGGSQNAIHKPSNMGRFPEWLFRYLKEVVDSHEVYSSVMLQGVQPLLDSAVESLMIRASSVDQGFDLEDEENGEMDIEVEDIAYSSNDMLLEPTNILQHLTQHYYSHSSTYFLREVARMGRHALRAKSFFHHPDVVGMECTDRTIVSRGIEQLFLFDFFLEERVKQRGEIGAGADTIMIPRLTDTFLSTNENLLRWWMEEERDGAINALCKCASSTLSSYLTQNLGDASLPMQSSNDSSSPTVPDTKNGTQSFTSQSLFPEIAEVFVALLHSARCKSTSFSNPRSQQLYIANVIAPLCSEYLDMVHGEAASLRKQLLARSSLSSASSGSSGVSVVAGLRSANLPSDGDLTRSILKWMSVITGTHIAARAVLRSQTEKERESNNIHSSEPDSPSSMNILERVGKSIERLRDAMIHDFISAFVETIVLERAKFASYMMRCPFVLSVHEEAPERRSQREKDDGHGNGHHPCWTLSPDLNDTFHVYSVAVQAFKINTQKLSDMFQCNNSSADDVVGNAASSTAPGVFLSNGKSGIMSMLSFGSHCILDALSIALSDKFMEIAIDPQGMTPEIHRGGALQFHHDVFTFAQLFDTHRLVQTKAAEAGSRMERVVAASRLMSVESPQIHALRETLHELATPNTGIRSLFERRNDGGMSTVDEYGNGIVSRLDVDNFYADERLLEEAQSMLDAKGYGALGLEEAISIINRRR